MPVWLLLVAAERSLVLSPLLLDIKFVEAVLVQVSALESAVTNAKSMTKALVFGILDTVRVAAVVVLLHQRKFVEKAVQ